MGLSRKSSQPIVTGSLVRGLIDLVRWWRRGDTSRRPHGQASWTHGHVERRVAPAGADARLSHRAEIVRARQRDEANRPGSLAGLAVFEAHLRTLATRMVPESCFAHGTTNDRGKAEWFTGGNGQARVWLAAMMLEAALRDELADEIAAKEAMPPDLRRKLWP